MFRSIDGGSTWSDITDNLPSLPCNSIEYENGSNDGVYLGTDIGVYYRDNNTTGWVSFMKDLPNVIVNDIEIFYAESKIRVATYGRGIWESDLYSVLVGVPEADFAASSQSVCSTNDTIRLIDQSGYTPTSFNWNIYPAGAQFVKGTSDTSRNPYVVFNTEGMYSVTLTASNILGSDSELKVKYLAVGGYEIPFMETWETSGAEERWEVVNPDNNKTWGLAQVGGISPGTTAMKMTHYGYLNAAGTEDDLISPAINLKNLSSAQLTFDYAYRRYNASKSDSLKVWISTDCGQNWTLLAAYGENGTGNYATGTVNQTSSFTPALSTDWCGGSNTACKVINLNAYTGNSGVKIRFSTVNGNGNNLFVDNINVTGASSVAPSADFLSDTLICAGDAVQFNDLSSGQPASWNWEFQGGTPSASTSQNPLISYASPGFYNVSLKVTNSNGVDSVMRVAYVEVDTAKQVIVSVSPVATSICDGDTAWFTATVNHPGAFPKYQWKYNGSSFGPNQDMIGIPNYSQGDTVWCEFETSESCAYPASVISSKVVVNVLPVPNVSMSSVGNRCVTDTAVLLTGGQPAGGSYSGNGVSNGYFDPQVAGNGSHWITYTYTDATGCSNSAASSVYVYNSPNKPVIVPIYPSSLICSQTYSTYQWIDGNGVDIPGATSKSYTASTNGNYSVRVEDGNGCFNISDVYTLANIGLTEREANLAFNLYPNPTNGAIYIEFNLDAADEVQYSLFNIQGAELFTSSYSGKKGDNRISVAMDNLPEGVYVLHMNVGDLQIMRRIIRK